MMAWLDSESCENWAGRDGIVCVTTGPRQGVEALRHWIAARLFGGSLLGQDRSDVAVSGLRRIVVVVPSRALADNLASVLASDPACSLGLSFMTLHGLALHVVQEAGEQEGSSLALDVLVSRATRTRPLLREKLGPYRDVDLVVAQTVRDLVHAGLDGENPGLVDAFEDALAELEGQGLEVGLARAILDAAFWVLDEANRRGIVLSQQLLARAAGLLRDTRAGTVGGAPDPVGLLPPCDAFVLYGFADVTGLGMDFLESLASRAPTSLFLDLPVDPADPQTGAQDDARWSQDMGMRPAWRFCRRFIDGMQGRITRGGDGNAFFWVGPRTHNPGQRVDAVWKASEPHGEMAAVAAQVRKLLDGGVVPEDIAVVFRDDSPMALDLRTRFEALAVPFSSPSGAGFGPRDPLLRPLAALASMLEDGLETTLDVWSQLIGHGLSAGDGYGGAGESRFGGAGHLRKLLAGARLIGVARLCDLEQLDDVYWESVPERLRLPSAYSSRGGEDGSEDDAESSPGADEGARGTLSRDDLRAFLERAGEAAGWLERNGSENGDGKDREATWDDWLDALRVFVVEKIGWREQSPNQGETSVGHRSEGTMDVVMSLCRGLLAPSFPVTWKEFAGLVSRRLESAGRQAFGGSGGGVQVMSVTQARGCRFRYLFLPEMNQGRFPRPISEDPLLSDALRGRLRDILDALPVKSTGHDEELYLFCQFLGAADHVYLSWHAAETDGKVAVRSSLLERLSAEADDLIVPSYLSLPGFTREPSVDSAQKQASQGGTQRFHRPEKPALAEAQVPRPERDLALGWALARQSRRGVLREQDLVGPLALLLDAQRAGHAWPFVFEPEEVARARARVFMEQGGLVAPSDLGPYMGMVGPVVAKDGARRHVWWATELERYARCPWQWFLGKFLGIEPVIDPLDVELDWDPLMLGNAFHRLVEALVLRALGQAVVTETPESRHVRRSPSLDQLANRKPVALAKPRPEDLEDLALSVVEDVLREYGPLMVALARPLAREVLRRLRIFLEVDWSNGSPQVLGAEVLGRWRLDDGHVVRFKADRLDSNQGRLVLTDYKTGHAVLTSAKPRKETQVKAARAGRLVQVAAYAGSRPQDACGRYLFVAPGFRGTRIQELGLCEKAPGGKAPKGTLSLDPEVSRATESTVRLIMATWEAGWAVPNLVDDRSAPCGYCDYRRACAISMSGARRRMLSWLDHKEDDQPPFGFVSMVWKGGGSDDESPGRRTRRERS